MSWLVGWLVAMRPAAAASLGSPFIVLRFVRFCFVATLSCRGVLRFPLFFLHRCLPVRADQSMKLNVCVILISVQYAISPITSTTQIISIYDSSKISELA